MITSKCSRILAADGSTPSFASADADRLVDTVIEPMASEGLRTIGIAFRDFDSEPNWEDEAAVVSELTLIMIAGWDDVKKGVGWNRVEAEGMMMTRRGWGSGSGNRGGEGVSNCEKEATVLPELALIMIAG